MASNPPAPQPSFAPYDPDGAGFDTGTGTGFDTGTGTGFDRGTGSGFDTGTGFGTGFSQDEGPWEEWNPTEESVRPVRGRHRVIKQRGGGLARSSTVLGVGVIAAVGAGGIATAQGGKPPVQISMPDLSSVTESLPGVSSLVSDSSDSGTNAVAPLTGAGVTATDAEQGTTDAGEALRARIMQQAEQQQDQAESAAAKAAEEAAAKQAAEEAAKEREAAEAKAAAEKKAAEEEARRKAEAERLAKLAASYALPTSSYTLTSQFGDAGSLWSSGYHTGVDFAAPTGTPLKAVHTGTVKEAGWSGSYGYRTVLELEDGTEIWYCHQSSISVSVGQKVTTGDVIGRVGATGNVTGAHLHLEIHPGGGDGVDPLAWLRSKGLTP
ncbi:M23 family metallopeptidase [Streptomyces himalayensis]|uniref:M23 family metallopeptidase n=1 Tax=Streptomyces himalayensis subsp. himalayensis TaxID=2756131 RepID=A0A7W0DRR5_9ACTN|nr:M23 family metallopeptidase [Streptomyces himalayensis]MBA2950032.1 M23 family metallopeptidase [Streptomyces himalayensis subsp. himalayensis]